jgi:hypothetical protein
VAGFCEHSDEPSGYGTTELVSYHRDQISPGKSTKIQGGKGLSDSDVGR